MKKRFTSALFVCCFLAAALFFLGPTQASAKAEWPNNTVNIVVGYNPGGSTDTFARLLAKHLEPVLGQPVVVQNVPGGGGAVGYVKTMTSKPDGYTVVVSNGSLLTLGGIGNVDFQYSDFTNLGRVIVEDETICVGKDAAWNSIAELITYAKENPGKLRIGFAGIGGFTYLAANQFIKSAGIEIDGIGYSSGAEAVAGLLGGFVDVIVQQPAEIYSHWEGGEIKILGTMGEVRHPLFPEVMTCEEQGLNVKLFQWRGISGPKNMPEDVRAAWIDALDQVQKSEAFRKDVTSILCAGTSFSGGDAFESWLKKEADWIYPLIDELGLKQK
ncbi:MAG: tripartite tricarboxylate transporter substrate binding protein [Aminobacterium sp.]|jgi:tripartite-type tricarboxylate transporter receptor subunit TctC|uniref:Bug family tripartite tricarboxylate transporter substrate binding protein n=1 Tax=unclassified Aminobacterium TaxID=2685012 RepID=UPI001BCFE451|nr:MULTISPECIES: tripartite tricarboxylate transporter substrate binding protein [unclassified Aminobacterium]MDD2207275.1 tripartite tricarboxylate transporter substrate binding protein [Aminobacterium sp.]MDD4229155.1 tripartite tricarboxylate transporter substrate binding protein [Aminobacterium sp.]MDD4552020.1 tripartite tricarboxylate transporter substrate binding protein [Aminobacterium sp.]MEA4877041.1 tripartite tricarboxylate transporter substrate binding protein [Aminobacterium sp.]